MNLIKRLAVYCGSAIGSEPVFADATRATAQAMVGHGVDLVYGGGRLGLMGLIADSVLELGGEVHGVIPQALVDIEVAHVVRRYAARGEIDGQRGRLALIDLADFPLLRYPHDPLLPRIWDLRNNLTAYDAVYVALAEALGVPLITRDRRLAGVAGHQARIELL